MKLRNKKTGEIGELQITEKHYAVVVGNGTANCNAKIYCSLDKLNAEWEDVSEEPKGNWTIDPINEDCIDDGRYTTPDELERYEELGLRFNTKEEAELAVRKLKAGKRLKDKGFFFDGRTSVHDNTVRIRARVGVPFLTYELINDLDLLFGGEE